MAAHFFPDSSFIPEYEVLFEGGPGSQELKEKCKKNSGHPTFIPISKLKMEDLPPEFQFQKMMDYIVRCGHFTVNVIVTYTSKERPLLYPRTKVPSSYTDWNHRGKKNNKRTGTGYMSPVEYKKQGFFRGPCPCPECVKSKQPKIGYWKIHVTTATHVIYDSSEAEHAEFECFYDSESKEGVKTIYGISCCHPPHENTSHCEWDRCCVICVTHDKEFGHRWYGLINSVIHLDVEKGQRSMGFMISHPHGCVKSITFGKARYSTKVLVPGVKTYTLEGDIKCRLPSKNKESSGSIKNKESSGPDDYVINDKNALFMTPGIEYPLPSPITITIPPEETDLCTSHFEDRQWYRFPIGATLSSPDGKNMFFPPDVFFKAKLLSHSSRPYCLLNGYITYDIDSCPGSSGAAVQIIDKSCLALRANISHARTLRENGLNCSGVALIDYLN